LTKFAPFTVSVNPAPPGFADPGERKVMIGTGLVAGLAAMFRAAETVKTASRQARRHNCTAREFRMNIRSISYTCFSKTCFFEPSFLE
jgi:hypothetical protein